MRETRYWTKPLAFELRMLEYRGVAPEWCEIAHNLADRLERFDASVTLREFKDCLEDSLRDTYRWEEPWTRLGAFAQKSVGRWIFIRDVLEEASPHAACMMRATYGITSSR